MEEDKSHAASLLATLNLQRERAQFCDCVVRQRQNPGQLHPAHRCVLAASSPVFASILTSTGVLLELQAPCLSDSVLALLLDYIYTGALPYTQSQQQYYSLLTAACYLQMDELQEALRACKPTEVKAADNTKTSTGAQQNEENNNTYSETVNTFGKHLPLSVKRKGHQYTASVDTCDDIDLCGDSSTNGVKHWNRKDACTSSDASTCCSRAESIECYDVNQNFASTTEVHRVDQKVKNDPFHSAGTEEEQEEETSKVERKLCLTVKGKAEEKKTNRKEEDKTQIRHSPVLRLLTSHLTDISPSECSSSSSSSSSLHPCSGAVPVIRHSSGAAVLQLATMPPFHPVSRASVSPIRAPDSHSGSTDSDTRPENHYGEQNPNNIDHIGTQSWDYKDSSNQSDSSSTDHLTSQTNEHMSNGLSHITEQNDCHSHCDQFLNKNHSKHLMDDLVHCRNYARRLKYKTDFSFDDFTSKHQRVDCSDVWMEAAPEEQSTGSQDPVTGVPLPVQDSDTGSGSRCEELCAEGEVKEEHSNLRCAVEADSHCDLHKAEASTKGAADSQHEHDSDNRDTTRTDIRHSVDVFIAPNSCLDSNTGDLSGFERSTSVEFERSGTEITEPHLSDPTLSLVGPSYHGHLRYHCLPQEETYLSHSYSRNHSHPDHSDHSSEEEIETFGSPGYSPLRQHFATGSTDQVLLLDISAKPAELLVAKAFSIKKKNGFGSNGGEQWNEAVSDTKSWLGETNKEGKCIGKDHIRPGAEVLHKAGLVEGENQASPLTVSFPPSVPESAQSSMSSTLSVCIPSSLSAGMPTNISAHLSNPVHHPFQCSLCDRSFSQRGSLNRHVRSHLGVRPFPCPRCPMTFSRQYRVTEHMRVHQRCVLGSGFQQPPAV